MHTTIVIQYKDPRTGGEWADDPDDTPSKSLVVALRKLRRICRESPNFKYRFVQSTVMHTRPIRWASGSLVAWE